jgi:hypothetical protein
MKDMQAQAEQNGFGKNSTAATGLARVWYGLLRYHWCNFRAHGLRRHGIPLGDVPKINIGVEKWFGY